MESIDVESWHDLDRQIADIQGRYQQNKGFVRFVFRGQANADWRLDTTLERYGRRAMSIHEYYQKISRIKPEVESFTSNRWAFPTFEEYTRLLSDYDEFSRMLTMRRLPAYEFLSHLRHHGYPTPLLDWSRSRYVASYFAFADPVAAESVAIYMYSEMPGGIKSYGSNTSQIATLSPFITTHRRHHLQQSEYTICVRFDGGWRFVNHEEVFEDAIPDQDMLWKFVLPAALREEVLTHLDAYNLNAYSLFGSEEALMKTVARRGL